MKYQYNHLNRDNNDCEPHQYWDEITNACREKELYYEANPGVTAPEDSQRRPSGMRRDPLHLAEYAVAKTPSYSNYITVEPATECPPNQTNADGVCKTLYSTWDKNLNTWGMKNYN